MPKKEEKLLRFVQKACSSLLSFSNKYMESLKKAQEAYTKSIESLRKDIEKAAKGMEVDLAAADLAIPQATATATQETIVSSSVPLESFASRTAPDDVFGMFSTKTGPQPATAAGAPPSAGRPPAGAPPSMGAPPSAGKSPAVGVPPSMGVPSVSASPAVGVAAVQQEAGSITDLRNAMMTELGRLKKLFASEE